MFFIIPKDEKQKNDFTLAVSDNGKLFVVNKQRQSASSGYIVPNFFFFGTVWKWKIENVRKLRADKRQKLLSLLRERGFFVKLKEGSFKLLSDYLEKELKRRKKKTKNSEALANNLYEI